MTDLWAEPAVSRAHHMTDEKSLGVEMIKMNSPPKLIGHWEILISQPQSFSKQHFIIYILLSTLFNYHIYIHTRTLNNRISRKIRTTTEFNKKNFSPCLLLLMYHLSSMNSFNAFFLSLETIAPKKFNYLHWEVTYVLQI